MLTMALLAAAVGCYAFCAAGLFALVLGERLRWAAVLLGVGAVFGGVAFGLAVAGSVPLC